MLHMDGKELHPALTSWAVGGIGADAPTALPGASGWSTTASLPFAARDLLTPWCGGAWAALVGGAVVRCAGRDGRASAAMPPVETPTDAPAGTTGTEGSCASLQAGLGTCR